MHKPTDPQQDLDRSLPAIASISTSLSQSQGFSPYCYFSPEKRKAISDVRRTFCLFVTFDLLFISLLWIIELNVSCREANPWSLCPFKLCFLFFFRSVPSPLIAVSQKSWAKSLFVLPSDLCRLRNPRALKRKLKSSAFPVTGLCCGGPGSLTPSHLVLCAAV